MSWVFRKIFQFGPIRGTVSKKGVGMSWGIPGFRIGISPNGKKYITIGIPGTGLYFTKYLSHIQDKETLPKTEKKSNSNEPWWKQKHLNS